MTGRSHKLVVRSSASSAADLRHLSPLFFNHFPFATALSLEPVVAYWESMASRGQTAASLLFDRIASYLESQPELRSVIADPSALVDHTDFLDLLLAPIFPPGYADTEPAAALVPFEYRAVYATPAFKALFTQETGMISGHVNLDLRTFTYGKMISAYLHILRTVYEAPVPFDYPVTFTTKDPATGLDRHFKIVTDLRFVEIKQEGDAPELSEAEMRGLLSNISDLSHWMRLIPPAAFTFQGVSVIRAYDVTDEKMVAMLERDLVDEGNLVNRTILPDIEEHVRAYLGMRQLELGLAAIDGSDFYLLNDPSQPLVNTFFTRSTRYDISALEGSLFERCLKERTVHVIDDLERRPDRAAIEDDMLRWGVRNIVAAPLLSQQERVGILYLWSPRASSLNGLNVMKVLEVLPVFSAAVKRAREEMRNRVQSVIMGQYTAIHPSVEWRFRQAAVNFIQRQERGTPPEVEPIVFENVYPLFAATDIRASSEHRNQAVQHDLLDHLELANEVLAKARDEKPLAVFYHVLARTAQYMRSLQEGLSSSDEAAVRDFLQTDLEPMLLNLKGISDPLDALIKRYQEAADTQRGDLYRRSRAFEQSVRLVNETISTYLDAEQEKIQGVVPHYFEKHQTDGVDFTIYAGDSLLENGGFEPEYVNVLRLWQLLVECGIARRIEPLRTELELPLETTHLVLVQTTPINIRYRFDETRFDVDGPHHVRFEIMKQRVEKARIKGTDERLTQPGRIAIVYSQDREAREYAGYLDFLREREIVQSDIEDLKIENLQGMKGLRALRVSVSLDMGLDTPPIDPLELRETVDSLV